MVDHYFQKWCNAYHHYIEEWYEKFIFLYNQHGYYWDPKKEPEQQSVPSRREFYEFCYNNTRKYKNPTTGRKIPPIVMTPRKDEELMYMEEDFYNSPTIRLMTT